MGVERIKGVDRERPKAGAADLNTWKPLSIFVLEV